MGEKYPALRYSDKMGENCKNGILTLECDSWEEFESRIEEYKKYLYVWRGQSCVKPLLPTIYRDNNAPDNKSIEEHLNQFKNNMPEGNALQEFLAQARKVKKVEFLRALQEYHSMILGEENGNDLKENYAEDFIDVICWSIGQHHGLKTPLLDWTSDPYKALFFGFCGRKEKNQRRVVFGLAEKSRLLLHKGEQTRRYIEFLKDLGFATRLLSSSDSPVHIKQRISHMFERINAQEGRFTRTLYNEDIEKHVKRCYGRFKEHSGEEIVFLIKILIPDALREHLLEKLEGRGITYKTMFPDLQGAVLHCNLRRELRSRVL